MRTSRAISSGEVEVIAISRDEWRISDPSKAEHDGLSLLGFVQRVENAFEITEMHRPLDRTYVHSFHAAIQVLSAHTADGSTDRQFAA
ncbi:MAG: hypothetical protein QOI70_1648 [Microbacteriaceae bacterium]|nr:hypothetical protein [Microbacteriaceae bacterium]